MVPEGFNPHDRSSPVTRPWEPIYALHESDRVRLGLEIRPEHTNSRGLLHGGLIAALADNALGLSLAARLKAENREVEKGLITTSLTVDFLGRAGLGQCLEVDTTFTHAGRRLGVAQAFVTADGEIIARANAAFAIS